MWKDAFAAVIDILPAVDVTEGRLAWATCGAKGSEEVHSDPLAAALAWQSAGASWIHLVDLDLAYRHGSNLELMTDIVGRLDVAVELSGGIVDTESFKAALASGAARVVLGTAALERQDLVRAAMSRAGERLAVGLDVRDTTFAPRGRSSSFGEVFDTLEWLDREGCARYVVTDVCRDGALTGPNLGLLCAICAETTRPVVASGGTATLNHVRAVARVSGVEGLIIGKALYTGAFTLEEALRSVSP